MRLALGLSIVDRRQRQQRSPGTPQATLSLDFTRRNYRLWVAPDASLALDFAANLYKWRQ